MSTLKRIKKVKDGYEIIVSCTNAPTKTRMFSTSEECHAFADEYLEKNYFGVGLNNIHHPEGDGLVLKDFDPESLEIIDIEIPMNERNLELAAQAGLQQRINDPNEIWGYRADLEFFADLVRQDERDKCAQDYLQDCVNAVEAARFEEREACARVCESRYNAPDFNEANVHCADAIRSRGDK